jgi:DNA-binding NarL/FixJ family response regulator
MLCDDHDVVSRGARAALATSRTAVVAEAGTADQAVVLAREQTPNVVRMGVRRRVGHVATHTRHLGRTLRLAKA